MKKSKSALPWCLANLVFIAGGIAAPWYMIGFDPPPIGPTPVSGVIYMRSVFMTEIVSWMRQRLGWVWFLQLFEAIGLVFVAGYVVLAIVRLLRGQGYRGKLVALVLIAVASLFLIDLTVHRVSVLLPGFWLFILGLISSAIYEWLNRSAAV